MKKISSNKKVSIIMPSFNSGSFILDAVNSVLSQSYKNWELIIVDDCSTDNTYEIINQQYGHRDNIYIFSLEKNSGTSVARNFGLDHCNGDYVCFLDSDDLLDHKFLEKCVSFLENNGPIITTGYRRVAKNSITDFFPPKTIDYKLLLKGNPMSCLTTMYNRIIIGNRHFPEDLRKCEDYVFWLNILKEGYICSGLQESLASYRITGKSKSSNKLSLIKYMFKVYHKTQKINFIVSLYYVFNWALYGLKKYKNVK